MAANLKNLSILVVEDTMPVRKLLISILEGMGIGRVLGTDTANRGLDMLRREKPDIIICDWEMQEKTGLDLVKEIRNRNGVLTGSTVPIIMMTGYTAIPRVIQARDAGINEFIVKPFTAQEIARRIAHVINNPRDFVDAQSYFGPDRRRKKISNYNGPLRRAAD